MSGYENRTVPNDTRVKVGHLVVGLVFLGLAGSWALREGGVIGDVAVGWLLPVILVGAGVVGLLAMLAGTVRRNRPARDTSYEQPVAPYAEAEEHHDVEPTSGTTQTGNDEDDTRVIGEEEDR